MICVLWLLVLTPLTEAAGLAGLTRRRTTTTQAKHAKQLREKMRFPAPPLVSSLASLSAPCSEALAAVENNTPWQKVQKTVSDQMAKCTNDDDPGNCAPMCSPDLADATSTCHTAAEGGGGGGGGGGQGNLSGEHDALLCTLKLHVHFTKEGKGKGKGEGWGPTDTTCENFVASGAIVCLPPVCDNDSDRSAITTSYEQRMCPPLYDEYCIDQCDIVFECTGPTGPHGETGVSTAIIAGAVGGGVVLCGLCIGALMCYAMALRQERARKDTVKEPLIID